MENIDIEVIGAGTGGSNGGRVEGVLRVRADDVFNIIYVQVGGQGQAASGSNGGAGGFGNGGPGGNGRGGQAGGRGGAGATVVRLGSPSGRIFAVAGGAGGVSGDSGNGGDGGANDGESGFAGTAGPNAIQNATGGTQLQGGNGGTSPVGAAYNGENANDGEMSHGGAGGRAPAGTTARGGGGGGSGYRGGGGGPASSAAYSPGGGGAGGSNYTGGITETVNNRGGGNTGNGQVVFTYVVGTAANQPPATPTQVEIDDESAEAEFVTRSTGTVKISAILSDPDGADSEGDPENPDDDVVGQRIKMVVQYADNSSMNNATSKESGFVKNDQRAAISIGDWEPLRQDTLYYGRIYAVDEDGAQSLNYTAISFWTNRRPEAPTQTAPVENAQLESAGSIQFQWVHNDPDDDEQKEFTLQYRRAATVGRPPGVTYTVSEESPTDRYELNPYTLMSNTPYEWRVRTRDTLGKQGDWSIWRSFYVSGSTTPPILLSPINDAAVITNRAATFSWRFRDPDPGDAQARAEFQYRTVGSQFWITLPSVSFNPQTSESWTFPPDFFPPDFHYEWQVRTYSYSDPPDNTTPSPLPSDWSESGYFWVTGEPGRAATPDLPSSTEIQGSLGCGEYRVFVANRGGYPLLGEITPVLKLNFKRQRDDISNCVVDTYGFNAECGALLGVLRTWMHEIVVFRNGQRVWEGPVTRITDEPGQFEIEAKDVMGYVYRRIMRQGYNDAYRIVDNQQVGLKTVVERAGLIVLNALAPYDPNVLPYLTLINRPDDARQSRVVKDWAKTAWEEIDDMAATAGLDYVTIGRRIILWDTHQQIGQLPEMRDGDFSDPPIISEYGMQLANTLGVTNNNGVYGYAHPVDPNNPARRMTEAEAIAYYGPIEQLASAYGESEGGSTNEVLTAEAKAALEVVLTSQAQRNISGRWPAPTVVRVPDNSTLSPDVGVTFDQLVPGVWIPLRAQGVVRSVSQMQKLDLVTVDVEEGQESVQVTMSPAPNFGIEVNDDGSDI